LISKDGPVRQRRHDRTYRIALLFERFEEDVQQFVGILNLFRILANDPDQRRLCLWLVQLFQVAAECRDDSLVRVGIFPEDVLRWLEPARDR
jgi:hypothetical protein